MRKESEPIQIDLFSDRETFAGRNLNSAMRGMPFWGKHNTAMCTSNTPLPIRNDGQGTAHLISCCVRLCAKHSSWHDASVLPQDRVQLGMRHTSPVFPWSQGWERLGLFYFPRAFYFHLYSPLPPKAITSRKVSCGGDQRDVPAWRAGKNPPHCFSFQHSVTHIAAKPSWQAATDFQHNDGASQKLFSPAPPLPLQAWSHVPERAQLPINLQSYGKEKASGS